MLELGRYNPNLEPNPEPSILCDDARLTRHLRKPWFQAYLARHLGIPVRPRDLRRRTGPVLVPDEALSMHGMVVGSSGSGKSRSLLHVLIQQVRAGSSVVLLDPKGETADLLLQHAVTLGLPPERVTLLDPRELTGIPGWNPLLTGIPLSQAVGDWVHLLAQTAMSWGVRLNDLLVNALLVLGAHQLSLFELPRFLLREEYRKPLLRKAPESAGAMAEDRRAFQEALAYFEEEFEAWSRSERSTAASQVLNKGRETLRSAYLCPLLCARRNSLDLGKLWQEPRLLIARLDRPTLGDEGVRLLAGLLTRLLMRTALRSPGPVPVVLALEEMPMLEAYVGGAIREIVAIARSQNLRCLVACQHLDQLSDGLRAALFANTFLQLFFRLGPADARLVATSLGVGVEPRLAKARVRVEREDWQTGQVEQAEWSHDLYDQDGNLIRAGWRFRREPDSQEWPCKGLDKLYSLLRPRGVSRIYVRDPLTHEPVGLRSYLGLVPRCDYEFQSRLFAQLVVSFPKPRVLSSERWTEAEAVRTWTRTLQDLPRQNAVLRLVGQEPRIVQIATVDTPTVEPGSLARFVSASMAANGQSRREIDETLASRQQDVEQLQNGPGQLSDPKQEADDGSLA